MYVQPVSLHYSRPIKPQSARRIALAIAAGIDDLGQLFSRIEAERLHAVPMISLGDGCGRLDRMHEAQHRLRQSGAHQPHFGNRCDIVMRDPRLPQHEHGKTTWRETVSHYVEISVVATKL